MGKEMIKTIVSRGAVDGVNGKNQPSVDSFDLEQNSQILRELHEYVDTRIVDVK